jgi:hypothetical protein
MRSAAVIVAPELGRPIAFAGTAHPARESQPTRFRTVPFCGAAVPTLNQAVIANSIVPANARVIARYLLEDNPGWKWIIGGGRPSNREIRYPI